MVEALKQLRLAKIAAVRRVRGIVGVVEFKRLYNLDDGPHRTGDSQRFIQRSAGQTGTIGNHTKHAVTENPVSLCEEKRAVHAAAVCDNERRGIPQNLRQLLPLGSGVLHFD